MDQEDKNAINLMRFPQKLWYLLNMHTDAIIWGGTGRTILLNYRILHSYLQCDDSIFKTTNISSFVRQLNLYGFRKVTSHLQDPLCNSCNPYMHEYVHDYFQYGRPELINKITRKALAMRKNFKPKNVYGNIDQLLIMTPLQKARKALRDALKKAAHDLYVQNSRQYSLFEESEGPYDELSDSEDNIELDWFNTKNNNKPAENTPEEEPYVNVGSKKNSTEEDNTNSFGNTPTEETLIIFKERNDGRSNDNVSAPFLNMPDLDPEPNHDKSGVELLAEFNIDHDPDQSIVREINNDSGKHSLNCVLPSINNDFSEDVSLERDSSNLDHGEWDQMLNEIMSNKVNNQECGSDLKELYSQISRTIDLLND